MKYHPYLNHVVIKRTKIEHNRSKIMTIQAKKVLQKELKEKWEKKID